MSISLPERIRTHPRLLLFIPIMLTSLLVFAPSLTGEFVLDDVPAVVENPNAAWPPNPAGIFTTNYWGNPELYQHLTIYRPLSTLSFALVDGLTSQPDAGLQRLVNIILNGLVAWVVALLVLAWGGGWAPSLWAGLIFCVHPVHSEAVIGVVSRAELLSALFVFLGVLNHLGWSRSGSRGLRALTGMALVALAVLSKENGATLVVGLLLFDLVSLVRSRLHPDGEAGRAPWWSHLGNLGVIGAYFVLRSQVLSGILAGNLAFADNPMVGGDLVTRVMTPLKLVALNLGLLIAPLELTWDYSFDHVQVAKAWLDPQALVGLGLTAGMILLVFQGLRLKRGLSESLVLFASAYSVVSNFVFLSTIIMAERLLYLPSGFFLIGLVLGLGQVQVRLPALAPILAALAVLVVLAGIVRTEVRIPDWKDQLTLARAGVEVAPRSVKSRLNYGNQLLARNESGAAAVQLGEAVSIDPTNFIARTNLGMALEQLGRLEEAMSQWEAALLLTHGNYFKACGRLCNAAVRAGDVSVLERWCTRPCPGAPKGSLVR